MIIKLARCLRRNGLLEFTSFVNSDNKELQKSSNSTEELVQSREKVELMEDKYQKLKLQGLQQRELTGVDSFQRQILTQNKFDLLDPRIKPKVASLSTTMGLELSENNQLTEVDLGKIKVKQQNEVFLSQVDPNSIPEYYNIVFDYEKKMSLVGKRLDGQQGDENSEMKVSTRRAFQEKSQREFAKEVFGFGFKSELSFRMSIKKWLMSLLVCLVFYEPIIATYGQMDQCLESIHRVEKERMQHLQKFKREATVNAIITNPDMRDV